MIMMTHPEKNNRWLDGHLFENDRWYTTAGSSNDHLIRNMSLLLDSNGFHDYNIKIISSEDILKAYLLDPLSQAESSSGNVSVSISRLKGWYYDIPHLKEFVSIEEYREKYYTSKSSIFRFCWLTCILTDVRKVFSKGIVAPKYSFGLFGANRAWLRFKYWQLSIQRSRFSID